MSLTEIKVRQAHCKEKTCFLSDEDGLSLKIEPSGRKSWCYRYIIRNKDTTFYIYSVEKLNPKALEKLKSDWIKFFVPC